MAGDIGIEEQVIVVSSQNREMASVVARNAGREGARVVHRYGPGVMIAEVPDRRVEQVRAAIGTAAAMSAAPRELPSLAEGLDPIGALGLAAFTLRQSPEYIAAKAQRPHNGVSWGIGGNLLPPDPPPQHRQLVESPRSTRGKASAVVGSTSEQLTGRIAVGIIIVSGPTTDLQFNANETVQVITEVQNGLGWHAAQNRLADISWTYDIHTVKVNVQPGGGGDEETLWRDPAMQQLGYRGGWDGVYDYVNHIRTEYATQWTYVSYFIKYPAIWFAYSNIGGPRLVMQYANDSWGPKNIDRVFAHETGHIFQAPDEYSTSGCNCGGAWGIYNKPNGNCELCAPGGGVACIMNSNSWACCKWTPWHYGQLVPQYQINNNTTTSTPFVTSDGWVWFQGTDGALWKVLSDGTQQSKPGSNTIASSPIVVGDWVYFRGTDSSLWRMKTDGSAQNIIGNNTTGSTPFVTFDGWVWFQGTDGTLWKIFSDGTQQSKPGNNTTASTPFVTSDGWVWFQGTDDALWKIFSDGTQQSKPGNNTTGSSPIVVGDWVYFRGTDSSLWRMKTDGSAQNIIGNNTTLSTPAVLGDWIYFRGMDNKLWACPITA